MITKKDNIQITKGKQERFDEILSDEAISFLESLHNKFEAERVRLLDERTRLQVKLNEGEKFDFLPETKEIRDGNWTISPLPEDLKDRRVEITGPVGRNMVINALNSGAKTFMACFEDATAPTWNNMIDGQINLKDAIRREVDFKANNGKEYKLNDETAVLIVRPRGWHLVEKNFLVNGEPISAGLFDFGLYFFHNVKELLKRGTGPYFYLPKIESHQEARIWNDVFVFAQDELGIDQGTIKATVLIETISSAFEMDEIIYELKDHMAGLNCGRWDYIFSYIKKFQGHQDVIMPDRADVTMAAPFMRSYTQLAIKTCHKREASAIGGMAAQIPVKDDIDANEDAFNKVRTDKKREVNDGHDGTWVAHPGMVHFVKNIFDKAMPTPNQIDKKREDVQVTQQDLLEVPLGNITEEGVRTNISVGIQYIAAWLLGRGAVPINNLMEDAATAEISRAQLWQWVRHPKGILDDGREITFELVDTIEKEELQHIEDKLGKDLFENGGYKRAAEIFNELIKQDEFIEFLTIPAYEELLDK
ncbi:MAG TPA: malate synthase A [Virgibacillus sp.]|nr:malate synthase A [Virgibacillus sp.]